MIEILVREEDATMPANAGSGSVLVTYRTFLVDAPELEAYLQEHTKIPVVQRQIVGWLPAKEET